MLKNKDLKDIRPAGGVKIKNKIEQRSQQNTKVIRNVQPPEIPMEDLEPPTEEAAKIITKINNAKNALIDTMRDFSKLLSDSKLLENRSEKEKQEETTIINKLISAVQEVERLEPGEGTMSLCVFSTRLSLLLRNVNNKLSHKSFLLEKRVEQLEKAIGVEPPKEDPKAREKQFLIEQAEKLGLKINIEE